MSYTTQDLADLHGVSLKSMYKYIKILKENKEFEKTAPGRFYSDKEALKIANAIGFEIPENGRSTPLGPRRSPELP